MHAMGTTHPAALLISAGEFQNPWLQQFFRRVLFPISGSAGDSRLASALKEPLARALDSCESNLEDFVMPPDRSSDAEAKSYCPRCHGQFLAGVEVCADCRGMNLRSF